MDAPEISIRSQRQAEQTVAEIDLPHATKGILLQRIALALESAFAEGVECEQTAARLEHILRAPTRS